MTERAAVPGVDPSRVSTPDELAACLNGLRHRRGLSYEAMEKAAAKLPSRSGRSRLEPLSKSTVGEIVTGKRLPSKGKLLTFLAVCEVAPADLAQWLAAWERASTADLARPAGTVRVRDAQPRLLGVHPAISVPGVPDDVPPEYVPRDVDIAEFGIRARVKAAAQRGGFVLLVGGSSVGKTRCAVQAVKALLPDWWLLHPAGPGEVAGLSQAPLPRTVVWLDELQRYLDGEHGLTGAMVRALLNAPHPAVIIGTLWPDRYITYTAMPKSGRPDPHTREREVLNLAEVVRIGPEFSPAEQGRARAAAGRDPRLQIALDAARCGLTQTLAAAPQLLARWEDARTAHPYGWAVLTAALDLTRLGARAPLSIDLLRAAAPGYCASNQEAEAPDNWFEQALAYATAKLHGAVAALSPAGAGMGQVAGYTAADYLIQHASGERRYARMPASTWDAAISHLRDPADTARLADSARNRLLYRYAMPLYRQAAAVGDGDAARRLADLLAERGDLREAVQILRDRASVGDGDAARRLARLLAERGDLREAVQILRDRADVGDGEAAWQLAYLLYERGDPDELRARADAGDDAAAGLLDGLLAGRGDLDALYDREDAGDTHATRWLDQHRAYELAQYGDLDGLRYWANTGDGYAAMELARLLAERGDQAVAEQILRDRADAGDGEAAGRLAYLLTKRGDLDEAEQVLRARANTGDAAARSSLADLLAKRGDLDGLRTRADAGDGYAAMQLADLLAERGDLDALYARADGDDWAAASSLADLLAERGDLDALYARVDAGDKHAAKPLANLLIKQGQSEKAERLRLFGLNLDGSIACA